MQGWREYRDRLIEDRAKEQAYLDELESGRVRLQRRGAGESQFTDYTSEHVDRSKRIIEVLTGVIRKIEIEQLGME